jgi:hypothetical protein
MQEEGEEQTMTQVTCPDCGGTRIQMFGRTKAGMQKLQCLRSGCRRQWVPGSKHLFKKELKVLVLGLLEAGVLPPKIKAAVPGISLGWLYKLRRKRNARQGQ